MDICNCVYRWVLYAFSLVFGGEEVRAQATNLVPIPASKPQVILPKWEINLAKLTIKDRLSPDLFVGTYGSRNVTVKFLKHVYHNDLKIFCNRVKINKLRHTNVVKVIGVCTEPNNLLVVMESMHQSLCDLLQNKETFRHHTNCLFINEYNVVKIWGFNLTGGLIGITGIEKKSDVFQFGLVMWTLMTREMPQVACVEMIKLNPQLLQDNNDPYKACAQLLISKILKETDPGLVQLLELCLGPRDPPSFQHICAFIRDLIDDPDE